MIIFSSPKPRQAETEADQISSFRSWRRQFPNARICIFGDRSTWEDIILELGLEFAGRLPAGPVGGEDISFLFRKISDEAKDSLAIYLNSDILLNDSASQVVSVLEKIPSPWLASSRRCRVAAWQGPALKSKEQWEKFFTQVREGGQWGEAYSLDIFLFRGLCFADMPPFLIGHSGWDNWIIYSNRMKGINVIDVSADLSVIHCDHGYSYAQGNSDPTRRDGALEKYNQGKAGSEDKLFHLGHATHELRNGTMLPRRNWSLRMRNLQLWEIRFPRQRWWWLPLRRVFHPIWKRWLAWTIKEENWNCRTTKIPFR